MFQPVAFIRPATLADLEHFIAFAQETGPGITSLPRNPAFLEEALAHSQLSFAGIHSPTQKELYLFCLEYEGKVIGSSGIVSHIGIEGPFFAFHQRIEKHEMPVLHFIEARKKPSEVGTLYLQKEMRGRGFASLLSYSRLLFLTLFRDRFASSVIAEMRGVNKEGVSPFWEAIGRHFFKCDFSEADLLRTTNPSVIEDLFPRYPLYSILLPQEAQEVIGKSHPHTLPAKKMLEKIGFRLSEYVDIFDAGPHLFVPTDEIDIVKRSRKAVVQKIDNVLAGKNRALVANTKSDFRVCHSPLLIEGDLATLPIETVLALNVDVGDEILYYSS